MRVVRTTPFNRIEAHGDHIKRVVCTPLLTNAFQQRTAHSHNTIIASIQEYNSIFNSYTHK